MKGSPVSLCFTCGQSISDPPRFNHLASGRPCPACRDRLLESLPSLLPAEAEALEPEPEPEPAGPARRLSPRPSAQRSADD